MKGSTLKAPTGSSSTRVFRGDSPAGRSRGRKRYRDFRTRGRRTFSSWALMACPSAADVLEGAGKSWGEVALPATIRVDQGTEFVSRDLDLWVYQRGVALGSSRPGKANRQCSSRPSRKNPSGGPKISLTAPLPHPRSFQPLSDLPVELTEPRAFPKARKWLFYNINCAGHR